MDLDLIRQSQEAEMSLQVSSVETRGSTKQQEVIRVARDLYQQSPDWVAFFREILGLSGIVRRAFPTAEELVAFEQTDEYAEIQAMMANLRKSGPLPPEEEEPTRVITVRMPRSLHESLRAEAHDRKTSMNKLCISKLLQVIGDELIPADEVLIGGGQSRPAEKAAG
jgi:predicted HicB family RNase H-like nuclease